MFTKIFKKKEENEEKLYCSWLDRPVSAERIVASWVNAGGDITSPDMVEWMESIGISPFDAEFIKSKYYGKFELEKTVTDFLKNKHEMMK